MASSIKTALGAALGVLLPAAVAHAQTAPETPSTLAAVQQRTFNMNHEIEISAGWLPLDPFTKTLTGEFSYTYHFSDQVAWEMVRGFYGYSIKTGLRTQAEADFNAPSNSFEEFKFGASSSLELSPIYGKVSLLNDTVVHGEMILAAGPMVAWVVGGPPGSSPLKIGPIGGVGLRVFANEDISVRFDVRFGFLIGKPSVEICTLALGVSFDFGHAD